MRTLIPGGMLVTPYTILADHALVIEEQGIAALAAGNVSRYGDYRVIDGVGRWVVPGFIDVHVHGGMGYDTWTPRRRPFIVWRGLLHSMVPSATCTTMTASPETIIAAIGYVATTVVAGHVVYSREQKQREQRYLSLSPHYRGSEAVLPDAVGVLPACCFLLRRPLYPHCRSGPRIT